MTEMTDVNKKKGSNDTVKNRAAKGLKLDFRVHEKKRKSENYLQSIAKQMLPSIIAAYPCMVSTAYFVTLSPQTQRSEKLIWGHLYSLPKGLTS